MTNKEMYKGEVIWFSAKRGFGFVSWNKAGVTQKDMFVHYSDLDMQGFKQLKAGQKVQFSIGKNHSNEDKAVDVVVLV